MQMSRVFEKSISAVIRYHGARRDETGDMVDDLIADALNAKLKGAKVVMPASVYITTAGELEQSHGVKVIAHVASVTGQVGVGWVPIERIHRCVSAVLDAVEAEGVQSVLFPLMGTGQAAGRGERDEMVRSLMAEAVDFLTSHPESTVDRVCFLAWTDHDFDICQGAVAALPKVRKDAL
jgi:O-acetyl-ADP-ribose deacetylase (regulator of RNase III)